jgi:hypothetical protein
MKRNILWIILILFVAVTIGCSGKSVKPNDAPKAEVCEIQMRNTAQACATVAIWPTDDKGEIKKGQKPMKRFKLKGRKELKKGQPLDSRKVVFVEERVYMVCVAFCRGEGNKPRVVCEGFSLPTGSCKVIDDAGVKHKAYINIVDEGETDGKGDKRTK